MKLSIVIPVYNRIELLRNVLDSISMNKDIEIIIVDDGSDNEIDIDCKIIRLERTKKWAEKIRSEYNVEVQLHDLGQVDEGTKYNKLSSKKKQKIINYYENLFIPDNNPKLLFVDQYTSCRYLSINTLRDKFDLIIYHDSESWEINGYNLINKDRFYLYELKTNGPCTMLMSKTQVDLSEVIQPYIDSFMKEFDKCTEMNVVAR